MAETPNERQRKLAEIDHVCRLINREVWVVTSAAGDRRGGLLATWVFQASIDPQRPILLIGIAPNHFTAELIEQSRSFSAHLITADQIDLAWNFALGSGRDRDKLEHVGHQLGPLGTPRLAGCLAWLDCRVFARLATGDRIYCWADIVEAGRPGSGDPLRERELFLRATGEQRSQLLADRDADIAGQRHLQEAWRANLPELLR